MPVLYQVVGFGRGDGRHSGRHGRSVVSSVKGACVSVQELTQISAAVLHQAITDTKNRQHYKLATRPHVYIVRQNERQKSNMDAFVAAQERSIAMPTNAAIGPSPAQRRAATSKNPTTYTLPHHHHHHHPSLFEQAWINPQQRVWPGCPVVVVLTRLDILLRQIFRPDAFPWPTPNLEGQELCSQGAQPLEGSAWKG